MNIVITIRNIDNGKELEEKYKSHDKVVADAFGILVADIKCGKVFERGLCKFMVVKIVTTIN